MGKPKWVTPIRQTHLVKLFLRSQGFCVYGHKPCPYPHHHYQVFIDNLVADWVAEDRARREADWQAERKRIHGLSERRYPLRGQFSTIAKDMFYAEQPEYYLEGIGISGLTFRPFAKVRLASSLVQLHIDLGDTLRQVSKAKRRKAIRYGKALPQEVQDAVDSICNKVVRRYLK